MDSDVMAICNICNKESITEKTFPHVVRSLHMEYLLQEYKSLFDAWKVVEGIFKRNLGITPHESLPKPCFLCLLKIIDLVKATYVMTQTYISGYALKERTVEDVDKGESPIKSEKRKEMETGGTFQETLKKAKRKVERQISKHGGAQISKPPDPISSPTIKRPISCQPSNSTVSPNTPVTKLLSPPSSSPPKPAEPLESPKKRKPEKKDKKAVQGLKHSPEEGLKSPGSAQSEKKVKTMLPQKKTESLGSLESVLPPDGGPESEAKKTTRGKPRRDTKTETPSKPIIKVPSTSQEHVRSPTKSSHSGSQSKKEFEKTSSQTSSSLKETVPNWKTSEFRTRHIHLLEKALNSMGSDKTHRNPEQLEQQVFQVAQTEKQYVSKLSNLVAYFNKTLHSSAVSTQSSIVTSEPSVEMKNIETKTELNTECITGSNLGFVPPADQKLDKITKIVEEVAMGKCGFMKLSKESVLKSISDHQSGDSLNVNSKPVPTRKQFFQEMEFKWK